MYHNCFGWCQSMWESKCVDGKNNTNDCRNKSEGCGCESSVAEEVSGLVDVTGCSGEETVFVVWGLTDSSLLPEGSVLKSLCFLVDKGFITI